MDNELSKKINALYVENEYFKDFNGYIFIKKGLNVIFEQSFGMADFTEMKKHNRDTIFCIASITKQFTAMCILMLDQWGVISIDDCIGKYLSDFKRGAHIKIKDMLNMTSGMPEYWCNSRWKEIEGITEEYVYDFIKTLEDYKPVGEQFEYCNSNYIVLGVLIEKVSGIKYEEFLQKYIFAPLHMERSGCIPYKPNLENIATGYKSPRIAHREKQTQLFSFFAAGSIYSTVVDLSKWDQALYTNKFINNRRLDQMFSPMLGGYGMGWYIENDKVWHGGDLPGFSTRITRFPKSQLLIIMLCNTDGCEESNMCHYAELVERLLRVGHNRK
ncbi:serine hydrolase domain-containing protein [Clostridium oryzae]|uniref:Penicillin-binding protein 4 n=1 Tax=Clostridium oryzae TaxID=1450648 RepID=A0A1V4IV13_9CLOT|nr:serine hydrolase domain-containing protein [Clostridium oryzae]OPJ63776.1 penicillin-binding protein 4* [Clostridium oryzae]